MNIKKNVDMEQWENDNKQIGLTPLKGTIRKNMLMMGKTSRPHPFRMERGKHYAAI